MTLTLAEPVATGGRLAAVGVVALGTGLFLFELVGEGRLAAEASPAVDRVDGRDLAESDLAEATSSWWERN